MSVEPGPLADIDAIMKATTPTLEGVTHARLLDENDEEGPVALCNKDDLPLCVMSQKVYWWFKQNAAQPQPPNALGAPEEKYDPGKIPPEGA
jgi:hypothetical protein